MKILRSFLMMNCFAVSFLVQGIDQNQSKEIEALKSIHTKVRLKDIAYKTTPLITSCMIIPSATIVAAGIIAPLVRRLICGENFKYRTMDDIAKPTIFTGASFFFAGLATTISSTKAMPKITKLETTYEDIFIKDNCFSTHFTKLKDISQGLNKKLIKGNILGAARGVGIGFALAGLYDLSNIAYYQCSKKY